MYALGFFKSDNFCINFSPCIIACKCEYSLLVFKIGAGISVAQYCVLLFVKFHRYLGMLSNFKNQCYQVTNKEYHHRDLPGSALS